MPLHIGLLNALHIDDHDVDYYYASRLAGEPAAGVDDVHFHVFAPRTLRGTVTLAFQAPLHLPDSAHTGGGSVSRA